MDADDPKHGTRRQPSWETVAGCACQQCETSRAYRRRLYKQAKMGKPSRISTALVRRHIGRLAADGWRHNDIALAAGVGQATISEALDGSAKKISVDVAAAIIGVTGPPPPPKRVPSVGTVRRLQSLAALGWLAEEVCVEAGLSPQFMADLMVRGQETVTAAAAEGVARVFERRAMEVPELTRARKRARTLAAKKGWVVPLCWDDIDHDAHPRGVRPTMSSRPRDEVDEVRVDRLLARELVPDSTKAEKVEAMRRWLATGRSERSLCQIHGWHDGRYSQPTEDVA